MIQHQVKHHRGRFAACSRCGNQPLHFRALGRLSGEPLVLSMLGSSDRHVLECPRCQRSTGLNASLQEAETVWGELYAQRLLPLQLRRRRAA